MQTPDPNRPIQYDPADTFDDDPAEMSHAPPDLDPLDALLSEESSSEKDDERLYTDEFIRANESASRSLFLGFLGIALLATSLLAWFILSQPQNEPEVPQSPVTVPDVPPDNIPDLRLDSDSPAQDTPVSPEGLNQTDKPLVFPANPATPSENSSSESEDPNQAEPKPIPALPEGTVPPPPPVKP